MIGWRSREIPKCQYLWQVALAAKHGNARCEEVGARAMAGSADWARCTDGHGGTLGTG